MNEGIEIQIKMPTQTEYLRLLGHIGDEMVAATCKIEDKSDICVNVLNIVVTEAVVNAIKHGQSSTADNSVRIVIKINDKELLISVYDKGPGFDLEALPEPDPDSDEIDETGRGLFVIKSLMDSVEYNKINGENVLEMKKSLEC